MRPEAKCYETHAGRANWIPHTHFDADGRPAYERVRPQTLNEYAYWAVTEGAAASIEPPAQINSEHGDREDWGDLDHALDRDVIRGLPFTKDFERYIVGTHRAKTPVRRALWQMHARDRVQSVEFLICFALVEQAQSLEHIQTVFRCGRSVVFDALTTLYDLTERQKAGDKTWSKPEKSVA